MSVSEEPPVSVTAEEVHAHPRRTGHTRMDLVLAVSAIFISAVSLFVAIEHGKTQRDLVSASSWPFVSSYIKIGANERQDIILGIVNAGVGPAKLQGYEVYYKGRPVRSGIELLRRCCGLPADKKALAQAVNGRLFSASADDIVLRAGEDLAILTLRPDPEHPELAMRFAQALRHVSFRGCYCSVLDECWQSDLVDSRVTKARQCPEPGHPFDSGGL
jgi:hypothetical protein